MNLRWFNLGFYNFDKTVPYVRKKGVAGYFQIIFHNFFDLVLLNFLFLLTSIPLLTIGASYKAFMSVCLSYADDEVVYPVRKYFSEFKKDFLKSCLFGIIFSSAFVIIAFSCSFYLALSKDFLVLLPLSAVCAMCLIILAMCLNFFFPLLIKTNEKFTTLFINSFILSFKYILSGVAFIFVILICILLIALFFPYSIPFVAILPFFLICLCSACSTSEKINKTFSLDTKEDEENE